MRKANQLTFTTLEATFKMRPNDPIKVMFDSIDWSFIHTMVSPRYSNHGDEGYDPIALFKAQMLIYLGEVDSDRKLAKALRYDGRLCVLCGFNFLQTPSNGTFSIFRKRLGEEIFHEILHRLIAQAVLLNIIKGGDMAIDSTKLLAFSDSEGKKVCSCQGKCKCPRQISDKDASWGMGRIKSKDLYYFGYKVHLMVDAKSQLPLAVSITPANVSDSPEAPLLMQQAKQHHPEIKMATIAMDAGYDAYENYRYTIKEIGASPVIALNRRGSSNPGSSGLTLSQDGTYSCPAGFEAIYDGSEKKNGRLKFRCPAVMGKCQCLLQKACSSSPYGRTFHLYPDQDYRLIGPIPRNSDLWKEKYKTRTSVERAYSEEKGSHRLANPRVRGLPWIKIHVCLALCAQIIKRVGVTIMEKLERAGPLPCLARS
jgi:hypothetical protein